MTFDTELQIQYNVSCTDQAMLFLRDFSQVDVQVKCSTAIADPRKTQVKCSTAIADPRKIFMDGALPSKRFHVSFL